MKAAIVKKTKKCVLAIPLGGETSLIYIPAGECDVDVHVPIDAVIEVYDIEDDGRGLRAGRAEVTLDRLASFTGIVMNASEERGFTMVAPGDGGRLIFCHERNFRDYRLEGGSIAFRGLQRGDRLRGYLVPTGKGPRGLWIERDEADDRDAAA